MDYIENKREREREKEAQRQLSRSLTVGQKRREWVSVLGWVALIVVVIGGLIWLAFRAGPEPIGESFDLQGRDHIAVDSEHSAYNSNPPTSGSHYAQAADWGIYDRELADEQMVHNLEHGGIWISYRSDVDQGFLEELKVFAKKHFKSVVLTKREANDAPVALAAWTKLLNLDTADIAKVERFYSANKNRSPEPFAGR